jgi:gliding motility-associated-like protein
MQKLLLIFFVFCSIYSKMFAQSFEVIGNAFSIPNISNTTCTSSDTCFTLTGNTNWQQGAVWDLDTIDLNQAFDATFCMFLGNNDGGADGFAFLMRAPNSNTYGEEGGGLGYGTSNGTDGIHPSVAIEFDTYYNSDYFDIIDDHTQLVLNGEVSLPPAIPAISLLPGNANVEDNNFHTSRIVWNPTTQVLEMYFDGFLRFSYTNDLVNNVFAGNSQILWGFTASTGGLSNLQQICFPTLKITIPDEVICETDSTYLHYFHENLTSYIWTDPNNQTILEWNSSLGTALVDTGFFANLAGDYTLTVEYNNHYYSETVHITVVENPSDTIISKCLNEGNIDFLNLFTNVPNDGIWSGPSTLSNGILGTFDTQSDLSGIYRYTSNSLSVCPINYFQVDVTLLNVIFDPLINLIPCTETQYSVEVNPLQSDGNQLFSYLFTSVGNSIIPNSNQATININSNTQLTIEIIGQDQQACTFDTIINLNFVSNPQFNLGADISVCEGQNVSLNANGSWNSFLWSTGSSNSSIQTSNAGIYWCEVESSNNCVFRDSIIVTLNPLPEIAVLPFDSTACSPYNLQIEATVLPAGTSLNWTFSDGQIFTNQNSVNLSFNTSGNYGFEILAISPDLCQNQLNLNNVIHVLGSPIADFSYEIVSNVGGNVSLDFFNNSSNYVNLNWSINGIDTNDVEVFNLEFSTENSIVMRLLASNTNCSDSIVRVINIPGELIYYVPNSFTPDGNMFNNTFTPVLTDGIDLSTYHLSIFNRWGELIFESFDAAIGWDGTYDNHLAMNGIYVWKITFVTIENNELKNLVGHINLMK